MASKNDAAKLRALYKREDAELVALEAAVEELRVAYDHYVLGLEKREPQKQRVDLERALRRSTLDDSSRPAVRFRFGTMRQRLATYGAYWDRTMRQIEEGTFRREGMLRRSPAQKVESRRGDVSADTIEDALPSAPTSAPSDAAAAAEQLLRSLGEPPTRSERPHDVLYNDFIAARRGNNEPVENVTYDAFARTVDRSVRPGSRLDVALKDGKVTLVLKRDE